MIMNLSILNKEKKLTSKERAYLRSVSHDMESVVIIGKDGITDEILKSAEDAIKKRELIKCKILPSADLDIHETADKIACEIKAETVFTIGSKFVLFRRKTKNSAFKKLS